MNSSMFKRFYCLGLVVGCLMYTVGVIGLVSAPTVWVIYRIVNR